MDRSWLLSLHNFPLQATEGGEAQREAGTFPKPHSELRGKATPPQGFFLLPRSPLSPSPSFGVPFSNRTDSEVALNRSSLGYQAPALPRWEQRKRLSCDG